MVLNCHTQTSRTFYLSPAIEVAETGKVNDITRYKCVWDLVDGYLPLSVYAGAHRGKILDQA